MSISHSTERDVDVAVGELSALYDVLKTSSKSEIRLLAEEVLLGRIGDLHCGTADPYVLPLRERLKVVEEVEQEPPDNSGDPVEPIRLLGFLQADAALLKETLDGLGKIRKRHIEEGDYYSDLRLALGAAERLKRRLKRLAENE